MKKIVIHIFVFVLFASYAQPNVVFAQSETPTTTPSGTAAPSVTPSNTPTSTISVTPSISPTPTTTQTPTPGPGCHDVAPGTSQLLSAEASGAHSIILKWKAPVGPVTHYLVSYGLESKKYIYGNPNVGSARTTSYTVGGLATGKKYYFVVDAINGCMPGPYSNELSMVAGGVPTEKPTATDTPDVIEPTTVHANNFDEIPTETPVPTPTQQASSGLHIGKSAMDKIVLVGTVVGVVLLLGVGLFSLISKLRAGKEPKIYE
jgi:hypothetical protein